MVAREAAYRESPEARGLARLYELSLNNIFGKFTAAEQSEYQELEKRFPCSASLSDDDPYKDVYDKIYGADALEKPDRLDQSDQIFSTEEPVTQDKRASHAADRATMDALNFWWRFGREAVVALLSMRDIDKTLELMQQEVDNPGFLERKIGYTPQMSPGGSLATITRLRGSKK